MNTTTITGPEGELRWGYHPAATLASWSFTVDGTGGGVLTATIISKDAFRVSQQPLTFVVRRPSSLLRWPLLTLQIVDSTLTATLGPQKD